MSSSTLTPLVSHMSSMLSIVTIRKMSQLFELFPIVLAVVAIITSSIMYGRVRRKADKIRSILSIICAILLIFAQSSWYTAAIVMGQIEDTWFANQIWTIFNILVMVLIITQSLPRRKDDKDNAAE